MAVGTGHSPEAEAGTETRERTLDRRLQAERATPRRGAVIPEDLTLHSLRRTFASLLYLRS
jgi:integrase